MTNQAETVAELARASVAAPQVITTPGGREFLIHPTDYEHTDVTPPNKMDVLMPKGIKQAVTLQNAEALITYLNRFKNADSLLLADVADSRIVAVLDYHAKDKAQLTDHRATLALPFSEEWKTWTGINGQLKPQLEFARFVEENAPDIKAPDAASLLEAVRDLQAKRSVNFVQAVRTASDNENFEYTDNTEARSKGELELPTRFLLSIPVYFGDSDVEVPAFLRWKLEDGKLLLGIKLHRAEHVRQAAFQLIVTDAMEKTGVMAVFGKI
jgi:uncharacterized protein YfdQ (DUF2303 family)